MLGASRALASSVLLPKTNGRNQRTRNMKRIKAPGCPLDSCIRESKIHATILLAILIDLDMLAFATRVGNFRAGDSVR
jgi:hypothetical protein